MTSPDEIDLSALAFSLQTCATTMQCDPPARLAYSRVWLFSGTSDTIVHPGVVKKNEALFRMYVPEAQVSAIYSVPAEHAWVTADYGSKCSFLGSPYLNNCGYDLSFEMLNFVYNGLHKASGSPAPVANLVPLPQAAFIQSGASPSSLSLYDTAFVYVATACQASTAGCGLHVAFHGCEQTIPDIGMAFVNHAGLNEVAEANRMIVLYPQAIKSPVFPYNPKGCFDWWGYTGVDYATKGGAQMAMVEAMRRHLAQSDSLAHVLDLDRVRFDDQ
jgi:hypothetical protein